MSGLNKFQVKYAMNDVGDSPENEIYNSAEGDEFSLASGLRNRFSRRRVPPPPPRDEDYDSAEGADEFSLASGKRTSKRTRKRSGRLGQFLSRAQDNRAAKLKVKAEEAKANQIAAKSMGNTSGDVALANALAKSAPKSEKSEGMSKGMKIGLVVGGLALLGVIGFVIYKKSKKGK